MGRQHRNPRHSVWKRGINAEVSSITIDEEHLNFEDKPAFSEVAPIGTSISMRIYEAILIALMWSTRAL